MTLAEAVTRLRTRFAVDMESDIDVSDSNQMTTAIMDAAKEVSRDCYHLWTASARLTLTSGVAEYDLLDSAVCALPVFHVQEVIIADAYMAEVAPMDVKSYAPSFYKDSAATPSAYVNERDSVIRLLPAPNATIAASSYSYAQGFYEHPTYSWQANKDAELYGPRVYHDLIIDKAALNNSKSYASGEGYKRRQMLQEAYFYKAQWFKSDNLSKYRKVRPRGESYGRYARRASIGPGFYS